MSLIQSKPTDSINYFSETKELVDKLLDKYLPSESVEPFVLHEAMRYSVMAGGKRIRPILAYASFQYCGGEEKGKTENIQKAMAALELIHTYSLIHDDLPCMDDDNLRRGNPTCHIKFGEAVAVLAGDALHDIAFSLMAQTRSADTVVELAEAIGTAGMIGGQISDVESEGRSLTKEEIISIHSRKTGALIRGSIRIGAILANADEREFENLSLFGEKIGLAFQIVDDLLDIQGDEELLGKEIGSDSKKDKATYPSVVGKKQSRIDADNLIDVATSLLDNRGSNMLKHLAEYVGQRKH